MSELCVREGGGEVEEEKKGAAGGEEGTEQPRPWNSYGRWAKPRDTQSLTTVLDSSTSGRD